MKIHLAHLQAELDMLQDERVELIATSHKYQDEASAFQEEADNLKEMYGDWKPVVHVQLRSSKARSKTRCV